MHLVSAQTSLQLSEYIISLVETSSFRLFFLQKAGDASLNYLFPSFSLTGSLRYVLIMLNIGYCLNDFYFLGLDLAIVVEHVGLDDTYFIKSGVIARLSAVAPQQILADGFSRWKRTHLHVVDLA